MNSERCNAFPKFTQEFEFECSYIGLKTLILWEATKEPSGYGPGGQNQTDSNYFLGYLFFASPGVRDWGYGEECRSVPPWRVAARRGGGGGSVLFISPFKAVQSDMTRASWSFASAQDATEGNRGQGFVMKKRTKE